jgi:hypothetical protein
LSEDQKFGEASVQADQGFAPMGNAYAPPPQEPAREYSADLDGIKEVARNLEDERRKRRGDLNDDPIPRTYVQHGGPDHGEKVPPNETISVERASEDLTRQRAFEHEAQQPPPEDVAAAIDNVRAQATQQPQPEAQPDAQTHEQQAQPADGVDPEIAQALQNPKIRAALEAEVAQAEQAAQYASLTRTAAQVSAASLFSFAPELASLPTEQLPHAMAAIAKVNPARAAEIQAQLQRTQALWEASRQAEAQRAATQQQQLKAWAAQQDAIFEREVVAKEGRENMQKITDGVVAMAEEFGLSKQELAEAVKSNPIMRSAPWQRMMVSAAKYHMAQKEVVNKIDRSAPPVQRPGVASNRTANDYAVEAALKQFRADASVANAVKLLQARRNSR